MKEKPFGDKEVDCDDTDAPCVLIWNGNEWVPREPGLELDLDVENSTLQNKPLNISTVITATLNIFISRNIFEGLSKQNSFLTFVTNLLICAVIATILCLVTFIQQFQYESNILSFNSFIVVTFILLCNGLFSVLLQKFCILDNIMPTFVAKFVSIIFSTIIIIVLPLTIYLFIIFNESNHVYFYAINSKFNFTEVKTFPLQINHELSVNTNQMYSFDEIVWNIEEDSYKNITNNTIKLVFCDNSLNCDNLKTKNALKLHLDSNNVFRQSSPYYLRNIGNPGTQFRISDLYKSAKELGHVYFSNSGPTIEKIAHILKCSKSLSISINNFIISDENNCKQGKFLNYDHKIVERICFKFNDKIVPLDIVCGRKQQLNKFTFLNNNKYITKKYLSFPSGFKDIYCCLNNSHFLEYYGECSYPLFSLNLDSRIIYYETPNCPVLNHRKHSLFYKTSADCLVSLSAHTECYDDSKYVNCDKTSFSCKDIIH